MDEKNYYEKIYGYMMTDGFYRDLIHLWQGKELFADLKNIFKNKKASEVPELKSFYDLYKRVNESFENDSGALVPIHLLKKIDEPVFILQQKDVFIFIDESVLSIELRIATPARSSGYIECHIIMKDGQKTLMPLFSNSVDSGKSERKYFDASQQVKVLADFLRIPWTLDIFVDD